MFLNRISVILVFLMSTVLFGQVIQEEKDSIKFNKLDEVVVTGQLNPQSVKKSVFEVKIITRKEIEQQAGNNLADLLNQNLNLNIVPNSSSGKSLVKLFGLDGQYFKILVDNVPIINDEGLGNNTDLTQINLDDIKQIEIVEGSMGVQYGANAVTGIINIITNKSSKYKWSINPFVQEESVGKEFGFFNKGRHIQSLKVSSNINDKLFASLTAVRNDFKGYLNTKKGRYHELNDRLRGHEWLPKEQLNLKGLVNYKTSKIRSFYKFEFFDEQIERYSSSVIPNWNSSTQTTNPTSLDRRYTSKRYFHHLNLNGKLLKKTNYNFSFSYQQQKRDIESYTYRIKSREKYNIEKYEYQSRKGLYSKGIFSNFLNFEKTKFQLGYEASYIHGFASRLAGNFDSKSINRELGSYDIFASSEIELNNRFSIRPGIRALTSSKFNTQFAVSLSTKYVFNNNLEFRTIVGTSPKLPNYNELYTYFVDANHDIRGNENLTPENGKSIFLHLKKSSNLYDNELTLQTKISSWYLDVKDRIELIVVNRTPLAFKYNNIDTFKNWGISLNNKLWYENLKLNFGISILGTSKILDSRKIFNDDFLYSLQLNSSLSYTIPKTKTILSFYTKHVGATYQFVQRQDANNNTIIKRGKQNSFNWMDASVKQKIADDFEVTFGIRNLANVTSVSTSVEDGGAHSKPPQAITLGYGRSYFLKLAYKLNIN